VQELPVLLAAAGFTSWLETTHLLVALVDAGGHMLESNPACENFFAAHAPLNSLEAAVVPESRGPLASLSQAALESGQACQGRLVLLPADDGSCAEYDCSFLPAPGGRYIFLAEPVLVDPAAAESFQRLSRDVAQLRRDNASLKQQVADKQVEIEAVVMQAHEVAHTDDLTLLSNRRQVIADLQREVIRSERYHTPVSISMVDVDHFKRVNDSHGHAVGDLVLRAVARYLRDNMRGPDIVGRYGGEEFLVILPNSPVQAAIEQAERLCRCLRSRTISAGDKELQITISAGVAEYRQGQEDWQQFLSRADAAMYEAKAQGRDRVSVSR
jgi:diguanylate cyclase (GGDEF)-like protein